MKLLLINPKRIGGYVVQPPLGLGYLATIAGKHCSSVELWDMGISRSFYREKTNRLDDSTYDVVGISVFTSDLPEVNKVIETIKTHNPKTIILIGGPHPTAVRGDIFEHVPLADYAFHGDSEIGFEQYLVNEIKGGRAYESISGFIYKQSNGKVVINPKKEIENLDDIEFPAWDLMKPSTYPPAPHGAFYKNYPMAPIILTRGCPMKCTFCLGANHKPRKRSIENIKTEVRLLIDKYNVRELLVEDENFTVHKKLLTEFCNFMIAEYDGEITWQCPSGIRLDTIDEDDIRLMKASGCHSISVGIEFGTEKMHKETKKMLNLDLIREKLNLLSHIGGINVVGFFMMGFPQETREDIDETVRFACKLPISSAQFNCFMPQPGTEICDQYNFQNLDYNKFHVHSISYQHPYLSRKELASLKRKAYLKFYFRPSVAMAALKQIHSSSHLYYLMRRLYNSLV